MGNFLNVYFVFLNNPRQNFNDLAETKLSPTMFVTQINDGILRIAGLGAGLQRCVMKHNLITIFIS